MSFWYSPLPSESSTTRASLDFGLRQSDISFRNRVVPGLGGVWFVRQLCWPLAALELYRWLQKNGANVPRPGVICRAMEALACKLEYREHDIESGRVLGTRAFGRDDGLHKTEFDRLRQPAYYVHNTFRQMAMRAIGPEPGLGFVTGSRFDGLTLQPVGQKLADTFLAQRVGKGGGSLRNWLRSWILHGAEAPKSHGSLTSALSPASPTDDERECVEGRLLAAANAWRDKRRRLAAAIGLPKQVPDILSKIVPRLMQTNVAQAKELLAAHAFGAMLDRARDVVAPITERLEAGQNGESAATLAPEFRKELSDLRKASRRFRSKLRDAAIEEPAASKFARFVIEHEDAEILRELAKRSRGVLRPEGQRIAPGPLFRIVKPSDEEAPGTEDAAALQPDRTGRTFRVSNFHALLLDLQRGSRT